MATFALKGAITVFNLWSSLNLLQMLFYDEIVNFSAFLNNLYNLKGEQVVSKNQIGPLQVWQLLQFYNGVVNFKAFLNNLDNLEGE